MRETGPPDVGGPLVAVCLLLVPVSVLAGCLAQPSSGFQLRSGDLVQAHLVVWDEDGIVLPEDARGATPEAICGDAPEALNACPEAARAYALSPEPPRDAPNGYEDARPLPEALVDAIAGATPGDTLHATNLEAWGPHRGELVEAHPLEQALPREVQDPDAYGGQLDSTRTDDATYRLDVTGDDIGSTLMIDRWCNERFCLFESTLTGYNETHLIVEHGPQEGATVHVDDLDTTLTVTNVTADRFMIDGNHRYAGETFHVLVHVEDARGPPSSQQRAPGFEATSLEGEPVSLADLLGQPVVLEFFATWCPSCEENAQHLREVKDRFGDEVAIVSIGVDPWEEGASFQRFIADHDITWPVIVDEEGGLSSAYGVGSLSTEVLVDPDGFIVHTEAGVADHERVTSVLEELTGDREGPAQAEGTS